MSLLSIPIEIRLRVYSELLVQDSPVEFRADHGPINPRLLRMERQGLYPAILRVNKTINREAIPLVYLNNRFRFPDAYTSFEPDIGLTLYNSDVPYIAPFLRQIGSNAGFLRHVCINFPTSFASWKPSVLHEEHIQVFQLIRDTCTDLKTVEIFCKPPDSIFSLWDVDLAAEMLKTLDDAGLKDMPSLEKIFVVRGEYDIDEEALASRESLMQKMPSNKWVIELTKVPPRVWISDDGRVEFDNDEDCSRYNDEMNRMELEREEREEQEQWEEEYYRRRNDPYWKNDSDYD
ncbi:hypothetical protein TGAM01_v209196 [Trichoderma gamsii]|uniref:Uncharacterized protein n=1 Tax=Trichoderma gamsii TaxID=398673 RepID=A0A2P4ZCD3_9HYPO|nr:hypothetical protein TGAM01_v209196 [Trichoderma gamsii]PON21940.1 hypothetical protein TGAM01_v209196 [Trichoderma gamsii]